MSIMAKLAAAIRAFLNKTHEWAWVGGRWIMRMLPGAPAAPMPVTDEPALPSAPDADMVAVKAVAAVMAAGVDPALAHLQHLSDRQVVWLQAMDHKMLCRIACADIDQIRAHVRGQAAIRGVLNADPAAVEAYLAAKAGIVNTGRRTLREELAERGIHP